LLLRRLHLQQGSPCMWRLCQQLWLLRLLLYWLDAEGCG
jgi:hypothetical protein